MNKILKRVIISVVIVALLLGGAAGGLSHMKKKNQKEVMVINVGSIASNFYMPSTTLQGQIATSVSQNIKMDKDIIVQEVFVNKGDQVKKGDKLITFDMTLVEMELNIAKLKHKKLEQDLNKAINRLNSLLNGGPVEETDQNPIDADNLGGSQTTDEGAMASAEGGTFGGQYLAAMSFVPILATVLDVGEDVLSSEGDKTETQGTINNGDVIYNEPSEDGLTSGDEIVSPQPTPFPGGPVLTPTPDILDPAQVNGVIDGEAPFYMTIDYNTEPYAGTGTKEDPYIFLCSSAKGMVKVMGSFFNKMAGYSQDGTEKLSDTGSWFQLEFHQNDRIADFQDRKTSCTGYYYIDGSLLSNPVYMFAETELTLQEASRYEPEELPPDDGGGGGGGGGSTLSRAEAIKIQKNRIASLKLDLQESDIKISKLEKKIQNREIYSKLDGTVAYVGDPLTGTYTQDAFLKVKSQEGYYVRGQVSELQLDKVKEGTILTCSSYENGSFDAEVVDVSDYPIDSNGNMFMGEGNPNASYYTFTASIPDKSTQIGEDSWLNIMIQEDVSDTDQIVISKAFVRTEKGSSYVYLRDPQGRLKKQTVKLGASVDGGYNVLIKEGVTRKDFIAFPYGKSVKPGAKTKEATMEQLYGF